MFTGMNKYGKGCVVQIPTVFEPFCHVFFEETSKTAFYRHLSTHLFWRRLFGKYIGYEGHLFFENVQNSMYIAKIQRKIQKKSFVSKIIVSELLALNFLYKEENTCHRQSMS